MCNQIINISVVFWCDNRKPRSTVVPYPKAVSPLKYTNTLATAEARQPATNGYLLRRFTPKIAGSEIPNRVDVNAGIHNSLLLRLSILESNTLKRHHLVHIQQQKQ